jgi:hypothetical protein
VRRRAAPLASRTARSVDSISAVESEFFPGPERRIVFVFTGVIYTEICGKRLS